MCERQLHFLSFWLQDESATYYITVFTFIFIPVFVGFIWLNTIISREIWRRRHAPGIVGNQKQSKSPTTQKTDTDSGHCEPDTSKDSSTLEMKNTDETNTASSSSTVRAKVYGNSVATQQHTSVVTNQVMSAPVASTERQQRQMRMFKVILILMSAFICCRLPGWLFLLYKLRFEISGWLNWILLYTFGALGLLNSMLNPFLYTFLNETIRVTASIVGEIQRLLQRCCRQRSDDSTQSNYANNIRRKSDGGIYLGS